MLGIATGARLNDNKALNGELDLLASSGAHALRWYLDWASIERTMGSGVFDFTGPDAIVAGMQSRHLEWCAGIGGRGDGHLFDQDHVDAFGPFAAACAERYEGSGIVLGWEGPNEAFLPKADSNPTGARYAALQRVMFDAVKGVAPTALVGTGGIIGAAQHLTDLYAAGARGTFEFVAWHPYTRPLSFAQAMKLRHGGWPAMRDARRVMVANGDRHLQMWITEVGWNTAGHEPVTEQEQADYLRDAIGRFRRYPWAGPAFVFTGWDEGDGSDKGDSMGLYRADHSPKLAAATFRELAAAA